MELIYLKEQDIEMPEYNSFYEKFHGIGTFAQRRARIHWYFRGDGFKLLTATLDGRYVGQSCAYKTLAVVDGKDCEWWWGVDAFVLSEMRGKGIGKALQKRLHEDCPNFSSASYSAANGIIKRKCGAREIMPYHQYYYPVKCYLSLYAELFLKKVVSRSCRIPRIRLPHVYYKSVRCWEDMKGYDVRELMNEDYSDCLSQFMEENLSGCDFHVKRSASFLRWKYCENPSIRFHGLEILKDGRREGVIVFTEPYNGKFTVSEVRISKVLDVVVRKDSVLTLKQCYLIAVQCLLNKGQDIDGLVTLRPAKGLPNIRYPILPFPMLSSYPGLAFTAGYLTFIDHDMEQMYDLSEE